LILIAEVGRAGGTVGAGKDQEVKVLSGWGRGAGPGKEVGERPGDAMFSGCVISSGGGEGLEKKGWFEG